MNKVLSIVVTLFFSLLLLVACSSGGGTGTTQDFTLSLSSQNPGGDVGQDVTITVTINPEGGFNSDVSLTIDNPGEVSASFNPSTVSPAATSTLTLSSDVPGAYQMTVTASGGDISDNAPITFTVTDDAEPGLGVVSGNISVGGFDARLPVWQPYGGRDYRAGEVIVKFKAGLSPQSLTRLQVLGYELIQQQSLNLPQAVLYKVAGLNTASLRDEPTLALARELNARADVLYAQPNYHSHKLQITEPNDSLYDQQWHYPAMNLPQAWSITTGSPDVVVAVIDTGMMFDANNASITHEDLAGKVVGDFDFISDPDVAGDGDGRDGNGFDATSDNHGSHVGGTIAAATNNGIGVAGAGWDTSLLNVRVLGNGGGTIVDVNDGSLWAAGISVSGVPNNPTPAQVLNLSLGGEGACSPFEQEGLDRVRQAGVIVVVAAGNENENASQKSPASCSGVITVGATGPTGERAEYSNFGSRIDVMAPGGDGGSQDFNNDGIPDGVLSSVQGNGGSSSYDFFDGTSMATPHVAGMVALLVAQKPGLTPDEALSVLRSTARPLSSQDCNGVSQNGLRASDCGAGLVDAFAALQALGTTPLPPAGASLSFSPDPLSFEAGQSERQLSFTNTADGSVDWEFLGFTEAGNNPAGVPSGTVSIAAGSSLQGTLAAGASEQIDIVLDRSGLSQAGAYAMNVDFNVGADEQSVLLRFSIKPEAPDVDTLNFYMDILAVGIDDESPDGFRVVGAQVSESGFISDYQFEVEPSDFYLDAWYDANNNDVYDEGDLAAFFPADPDEFLSIDDDEQLSNINFKMWRISAIPESLRPRLERLEQRQRR